MPPFWTKGALTLSYSRRKIEANLENMDAVACSHGAPYLQISGRRGSNSRPSAWEADALPTELLPHSTR